MRARKAGPILALVGALACQPREPLPTPAVAAVGRARAALRRARVEAAREAGPLAELDQAVAASALLERRLAEERAARFGPSHAGEIERLALAAETAAWNARLAARRQAVRRQAAIEERRAGLAERLSAFAPEVEQMPGDQPLRAEFQATRLGLAAVAAAGERGDLSAADRGLETAAAGLTRVEALVAGHYARLDDPALRRRWQDWVDATVAESREGGTAAVIVDKRARRCYLLQGGRVVEVFTAELGRNGLADKTYAGDAATPEGRYRIVEKKEGDETSYHRALALDYPTAADRREFAAAQRRGQVPAGRGIGGAIEIHGHGGRGTDWTNGCVALPDAEMDRLFAAVDEGTPVTLVGTADLSAIFPGRGARRTPR